MKSSFYSILFLLFCLTLSAQTPQAFNYQGVARDAAGNPLINTPISLRIAIIEDAPPGTEVYKETHLVVTNRVGLFNIEVGRGTSPLGQFSDIDWGNHDHYIEVEIDVSGGNNFSYLGVAQLLSVPYALHAGNGGADSHWSENPSGIHYNDGNVGIGTEEPTQKLTIEGNDPVGTNRNYIYLNNKSLSNRSEVYIQLSAGDDLSSTYITHSAETYDIDNFKFADFGLIESRGAGLSYMATGNSGVHRFLTDLDNAGVPIERMRISNNGNVGIGTEAPNHKLTIEGNTPVGDDRNYFSLKNKTLSNRSVVFMNLSAGDDLTYTTIAHHGETYDLDGDKFRDFGQIQSTGRGLILRTDAVNGVIKFLAGGDVFSPYERMRITGDGNIGIGTENPIHKLDIVGNNAVGDDRVYLSLNNQSTSNQSYSQMWLTAGDPNTFTTLSHFAETYNYEGEKFRDFGQLQTSGRGLILRSDALDGVIKFLAGGDNFSPFERMRIAGDGNVGIGTEDPVTKLQITNGDVYIENINNGVIMKSPNGSCWRMTINNDGSVKTTSITCPN